METLLQRDLREDYEAGDDYHSELWHSEMVSMQREGEYADEEMRDERGYLKGFEQAPDDDFPKLLDFNS